ncbi:Hydrogenase maturation factor [Candidatus Hydrogenisulfobacillus filiaventi]|uniref:Hydrogenase maturation factor HypA n=1 Tax=Candidatus Hydrogenisulfobacillus filiaventi TaxID=2707344 RepID=A0A6F8ZFQ0_9FIRM|nr:Hydrogenase maturation factor [Candidatus Hydrogenisulfobacillus filiaventi]
MHEMGLMAGVLEVVHESAVENHIKDVTVVRLRVGKLNGALPDALEFAFEALRADWQEIKQAELVIESVPGRMVCLECGLDQEVSEFGVECVSCGSWVTEVRSGTEFEIVGYEGFPSEERGQAS